MAANKIAIVMVLWVVMSGCDTIVRTTEYEDVATEVGRGDCYTISDVESWIVIDDHHLYVVDAGSSAQYLVTTKSMCRGLLYSRFIEFPYRAGLVCQNESRVAYKYSELRKSCGLDNIEVVASHEAAITLVSSRTRVEE